MVDANQTLGEIIRAARQKANKTQKQCATELGFSTQSWSQIENNERTLPLKHAEKVAMCLAMDVQDLLKKIQKKGTRRIELRNTDHDRDILPLLRVIVGSGFPLITIGDVETIMNLESMLPSPMSPGLIAELLKNRHSQP